VRDERLPRLAGLDLEQRATVAVGARDPARRDVRDRAGEPLVGHHDVAAAGEDEQRLAAGVGLAHRRHDLVLRGRGDETGGRAAQAQGGELGESRHRQANLLWRW
jgi:hypothetical protein